ncbi:MAG: hypothetical protein GDA53_05765 [Rhodobacteraceae bacterium]|nr:hypothetical protein [Paracoccaceae bacterium]
MLNHVYAELSAFPVPGEFICACTGGLKNKKKGGVPAGQGAIARAAPPPRPVIAAGAQRPGGAAAQANGPPPAG